MPLIERVHIARRFQRSIRIDTDLNKKDSIQGFVCPKSSSDALLAMVQHIRESGQGAFTWTGPYGSGKSSLAVLLSCLVGRDSNLRNAAEKLLGDEVSKKISETLQPHKDPWRVIPVVGRRDSPVRLLGESLNRNNNEKFHSEWKEGEIVSYFQDLCKNDHPRSIIIFDEMGKCLEGAAQEGNDIYLFQQIAEIASRSHGRLIFIGILHQSFEEYANRLSREMREEWSKIQGRFVDLAINTAGEEQIELISRAIETKYRSKIHSQISADIASIIKDRKPSASKYIAQSLEECWPLHPTVSCLLGPISRRRFGQNQRSIFGFLNSAEPFGFQDFLKNSEEGLFGPDKLWDYLRANLEPSILSSSDGHRWAVAAEAIDRCESYGGKSIHLIILKLIALVDLFKERSGLSASLGLITKSFPEINNGEVIGALEQLVDWSLIIFRKFDDSYAIFAGSDFDIEEALNEALSSTKKVNFRKLKEISSFQPILAKRFYHCTGALWWFDVELIALSEVIEVASSYQVNQGTLGKFLLTIPTGGESKEGAEKICREAARKSEDIIVGLSPRSWVIIDLARELLALEKVRTQRIELAGDPIARKEIFARIAKIQGQLESEFGKAFDSATWYIKHHAPKRLMHRDLNIIASELASKRFHKSPKIHNELLNRMKPSPNAIAAQNALLRCMVQNEGKDRLGIDGFPAEGGLFVSLLEATKVYAKFGSTFSFVNPSGGEDPCNLGPLWIEARDYLVKNVQRTVPLAEIYKLWKDSPFGVKEGLMPVLGLAFILSQRENLAFYRQGIFQAQFKDIDVDYLITDPSEIQVRWMDLSGISKDLLSGLADIVRTLDGCNKLRNLEPIDVARGLISIFERLHPWTKRTMRLSRQAIKIRELFKLAHDPNKFIFEDLPNLVGAPEGGKGRVELKEILEKIKDGLVELDDAYGNMLNRLKECMFTELQVPNSSGHALADLRERAENIKQVSGDLRLDAFIGHLTRFNDKPEDFEGICSLVASKPVHTWGDLDLDRAMINIAEFSRKFLRMETFAHVKGRTNKRHSMAIFLGEPGKEKPIQTEFEIKDSDMTDIIAVVDEVEQLLMNKNYKRETVLAAIAHIFSNYKNKRDEKKAS